MALKQIKNVRSANGVAIFIGGIQVGGAQSVRANDDYGLEPAYGIGDSNPIEHVPGATRHSLSVSKLVLFKNKLREAGVEPQNSQDALKGTVFDIELYDKESGESLRKYKDCSYGSGSLDISANRIISASAEFMARDVSGTGV